MSQSTPKALDQGVDDNIHAQVVALGDLRALRAKVKLEREKAKDDDATWDRLTRVIRSMNDREGTINFNISRYGHLAIDNVVDAKVAADLIDRLASSTKGLGAWTASLADAAEKLKALAAMLKSAGELLQAAKAQIA